MYNTNHSQLDQWRKNPKFPVMFNTRENKTRLWACWVIDDTLYRTDGNTDGKIKTATQHVYTGNTLRTASQQALAEAEKKWIQQINKGYSPNPKDAPGMGIYNYVLSQLSENGGMNRGVKMWGATGITTATTSGKKDLSVQHFPMLAKKYKDYDKTGDLVLSNAGKAVQFPALVQAKVDGLRAIARMSDCRIVLESRNGKDYMHLEHIRKELASILGDTDYILDGEMYVHQLYKNGDDITKKRLKNAVELSGVERFQFLSETCKITRTNAHAHENLVEYWIFDLWDPNQTNAQRWETLRSIFKGYTGNVLKLVPTFVVNSHDEIESRMQELVGETNGRSGFEFEGTMVRQLNSLYISKNNYHCDALLKYKRFEDEEWEIVDAEECEGSHKGAIKWICKKTVNGKTLQVVAKQMGSVDESKKIFTRFQKRPQDYKGKFINIRFNDRTKDGIPRFPRATVIPEDKKDGTSF